MRSDRPTLKDVATLSGFGLRTVKKVMSGDLSVREQTRLAVLQAANELQYTRNQAASALARNRTVRIAAVYNNIIEDAYYPAVEQGFLNCEKELRDFGLAIEFCICSDPSPQFQHKTLETLLHREDIDGVVIEPYSGTALNDLIGQLTQAGKPVATFCSDAPESSRVCHVGSDGYKAGRIASQILANYIGKEGKVYMLSSYSDHVQDTGRRQGFLDRLREHYPKIEPVMVDDSQGNFCQIVRQVVARGDVTGLYCTHARTVLAGKVLKELGRTDIPLVGFDLSEEGKTLMREGYIKVIIEQKPELFSYLAAKRLFLHIAEGQVPTEAEQTPLYVLTSECLD